MTLFEYLSIAFGLLYTVAAMRLIGGLPHAIDETRRYWVHLVLVVTALLGIAVGFWTFWAQREVSWTFPRFVLALALPGLTFYYSATLVPENAGEVESWFDHYYAVRSRFFAGFGCWAVMAALNAGVNLGMPLLTPLRLGHALLIGFGVVGALARSPAIHGWLAVAMLLFLIVSGFVVGTEPGWLGQ